MYLVIGLFLVNFCVETFFRLILCIRGNLAGAPLCGKVIMESCGGTANGLI